MAGDQDNLASQRAGQVASVALFGGIKGEAIVCAVCLKCITLRNVSNVNAMKRCCCKKNVIFFNALRATSKILFTSIIQGRNLSTCDPLIQFFEALCFFLTLPHIARCSCYVVFIVRVTYSPAAMLIISFHPSTTCKSYGKNKKHFYLRVNF